MLIIALTTGVQTVVMNGGSGVSLSVVSVRGVHPMGERTAMLHRNLRGRGIKIRDQPISIRNLISWLSGKSLKLLLQRCHILMLKCTKFFSRRLSACPSVHLLDGVWHLVHFRDHILHNDRKFWAALYSLFHNVPSLRLWRLMACPSRANILIIIML